MESDVFFQETTSPAQTDMDVDTGGGVTQEPPPIRLEQEKSACEIDDGSQELVWSREE